MKKKMTAPCFKSLTHTITDPRHPTVNTPPPPAPSALRQWDYQESDVDDSIQITSNGFDIAFINGVGAAERLNAKLICEAVNQHPAFTARIKELEGIISAMLFAFDFGKLSVGQKDAVERASRALQGGNP